MASARWPALVQLWLAILFTTYLANLCNAQEPSAPPENQRPRVGLALSGGGALGLAEIGVIRWLEENHIPVDRIAGM